MFLARIDGTVTSTVKHEALAGMRLLIAQRLEADGREVGEPMVVGDPIGVRHGALVMLTSDGAYACRLCHSKRTPLRFIVLGIIDAVDGSQAGQTIALRPPKPRPSESGTSIGFGRLGVASRQQ